MWSWIRVFSLAFDVTEMRKEEPSNFFSFGIVSRQEKMSAFVGKQVVLLVHTKLFLTATKKKKKFSLRVALLTLFFSVLFHLQHSWVLDGDRFPYCISLFKATSSLYCKATKQGSNYVCVMRKLCYKKNLVQGRQLFFDYYCNLAQQLNLFLH